MNTLITIRPGLPVVSQEWPAARLEYGAPPFADMRLLIGDKV